MPQGKGRKDKTNISVVGICGSIRAGSYTKMALEVALKGAEEVGAKTQLIDLRAYSLIFCDGKDDESHYPKDVFKLRREVKRARGIILGTPVYHGSFSGVLKNAIDLMGFDEFEGKMLGLIGVSGGRAGAINALTNLRNIGRVLHAWVIPEEVSIPQVENAFTEAGKIKNPELENRLMEVGRQVARYAYLHSSEKAMEFIRLWEGAPINPGGRK